MQFILALMPAMPGRNPGAGLQASPSEDEAHRRPEIFGWGSRRHVPQATHQGIYTNSKPINALEPHGVPSGISKISIFTNVLERTLGTAGFVSG